MTMTPAAAQWLGRLYFALSVLLWPLTTIISTACAIKLKIPRPAQRRAPRAAASGAGDGRLKSRAAAGAGGSRPVT